MCCTLSLIGVSGFFTSWATWRAISPQARTRSVRNSSVMSSRERTIPPGSCRDTSRARTRMRRSPSWNSTVASRRWSRRQPSTHATNSPLGPPKRGMRSPTSIRPSRTAWALAFTRMTRPRASSATTPVAASSTMASVRLVVLTRSRLACCRRNTMRLKAVKTDPNSSALSPGTWSWRLPPPTFSDATWSVRIGLVRVRPTRKARPRESPAPINTTKAINSRISRCLNVVAPAWSGT